MVVRAKGSSGFADVELDCAGKLSGWAPVDPADQYEYTRVDLVRHDFEGQGACNNGRHEIHSDSGFGLTVWGWDSYVSYAYPSGASVQPINTVVIPPNPK